MKVLDNFSNIGKAVLIQALGIQKNYSEIIETSKQVIDYSNSSCKDCKCKAIIDSFDPGSQAYKDACNTCSSCPLKTFTQQNVYKKVYHNERNRYGSKIMLKTNALKLFMLLHFYHPDRHGIIKSINTTAMADYLGCNEKTIWNNLDILSRYSYISFSKNDTHDVTILLNDYMSYYLPGNMHGSGFIVFSEDLLHKLVNIKSIVAIRVFLREIISLDNTNLKGQACVDYKKMDELRSILPAYCKPCIIKNNIFIENDIFEVSINDHNLIKFEIDQQYIGKNQKEKVHEECMESLYSFIRDFNTIVPLVNTGQAPPDSYREFFASPGRNDSYKFIVLTDLEIDDLASLAVHYSINNLISALAEIYNSYILPDIHIKNLAGLVSTIIRSQINTYKKAA
ncbi:MAG: hypothetical protein ACI4E1_07130 [Lachnospira sp.]